MELDQLKFRMQQYRDEAQANAILLSQEAIEKISLQKSAGLLDLIDENLKKNMRYGSVIVILCIGIVLYFYDSAFWSYYFLFGTVVEGRLICMAYILRKNIHQNYETDLPLIDRLKNIRRLLSDYLSYYNLAGITICLLLTAALSIKNIETFNLASIFNTSVFFRFVIFGVIFCFSYIYTYKKYAKPHQDMLVDLQCHIAELEDFHTTAIKIRKKL
ncbi:MULTISPECIES: hypothetical protein [Sphingobacterium]|uniref:hypothetical protein n=1 Tax=Sphingobacterium TaxID=28453 RepID=UPI00257C0254|nr:MULTISPECIES: hypothetical protein [Sphingobacterium]